MWHRKRIDMRNIPPKFLTAGGHPKSWALEKVTPFQHDNCWVSIWGFPKMVVPNNHGVSLKIIILGCLGGTII